MNKLATTTVIVIGVATVVSACSTGPSPARHGDGAALHPGDALEFVENPGRFLGPARPGVVWIYGEPVRALDEVVLRSATLARADPGNELRATRAAFLGNAPGGYAQSLCAPSWPPPGFGPTVPIDGFKTTPGMWFVVHLFLQAQRTGPWSAEGIEFVYEQEREPRRQIDERLSWAKELTDDDIPCDAGIDDPWFPRAPRPETMASVAGD